MNVTLRVIVIGLFLATPSPILPESDLTESTEVLAAAACRASRAPTQRHSPTEKRMTSADKPKSPALTRTLTEAPPPPAEEHSPHQFQRPPPSL